MTEKVDRKTPRVLDVPLDEAMEGLTGFELLAIGKLFKAHLTDMDPIVTMFAVVWCYENRDGKTMSWASVGAMTTRQVQDYFADPSEEFDDEVGKESSSARPTTEPWLPGASTLDSPQPPTYS